MDTTIARIGSANWAKVLLLLWLVQVQATAGEPNPACNTMPTMNKDIEDKCCDVPEMFPNETLNACMEEYEQSSKPPLQKSCEITTCVLKKQSLIKSDNTVDKDKIKSYIKEMVKGSDEWKTLVEKAVLEECLPLMDKDPSNVLSKLKSSLGDCDPAPALTIACAAAKFYVNCPAKDRTTSPMCDEWRTFLSKCSNSLEDLNAILMVLEDQKTR
ncbi:general odorant-binding protein 66 [Anopheles merus]|uniref:general odorant-binding protein 66 n=1 Tax=Anopheles merus TaxID=30066 RepID=UPI001BE3F380|nr:general odorant-binding protein 66 [Anopheles merus]